MSNIFDIHRFGKLFTREFGRYSPKLIGIGSVGLGIFALTVIYSYVFQSSPLNFSFVAFGVALTVLAPIIYHKRVDRTNSIFDFTLPVSSFEKFLVKWSFSVILMPAFVIAYLLLIGWLYRLMPGGMCVESGSRIIDFLKSLSFEQICSISALQSFFLVGSFYFRKHVFWKVSLSLIIYFLLFALVFILFHQSMFLENHQVSLGINFWGDMMYSDSNHSHTLSGINRNLFVYISLNLVAPLGMWVVSFLKLRETEV
ncbi:MAG: hypothetical protein BGN96_11870 [Bacteroidales bacterium 45-6]|nr:MAG: hypothetical protein BGN96_11870 [Bacteroidales bacterium 45-6]